MRFCLIRVLLPLTVAAGLVAGGAGCKDESKPNPDFKTPDIPPGKRDMPAEGGKKSPADGGKKSPAK